MIVLLVRLLGVLLIAAWMAAAGVIALASAWGSMPVLDLVMATVAGIPIWYGWRSLSSSPQELGIGE